MGLMRLVNLHVSIVSEKSSQIVLVGERKECFLCLDLTFNVQIPQEEHLASVTWSPSPAYEKEGKTNI